MAGGLAGGSADAAAVIAGLARWWGLEPTSEPALAAASDPGGNAARFTKAMTISGEELANHEGGLRQMLEVYEWDAVVLQGHSLEAVDEKRRPGLEAAAEKYAGLIRGEGAEPVIFMTWAYRDRPEMTAILDSVYTALGERLGMTVAPVGLDSGIDVSDPSSKASAGSADIKRYIAVPNIRWILFPQFNWV